MTTKTTTASLVGIFWRGDRSGQYYVSLYDSSAQPDAEKALDLLLNDGSLPDYSPGCELTPPFETLELGLTSSPPVAFDGKEITYLGSGDITPIGCD